MSLLRAIATQQVDENKFLDSVKSVFKKKEEPQPETHSTTGQDNDTALRKIAAQLSDSGNSIKFALGLSFSALSSRYLKKGGELDLVNDSAIFTDEQIRSFVDMFKTAKTTFSIEQFKTFQSAERLALFAVPKQLIDKFNSITDITVGEKEKRALLANILAHKYYQMSLKTKDFFKLLPSMEQFANEEGSDILSADVIESTFNPYVIENHPAGILKSARREWDEKQKAIKDAPGIKRNMELDDEEKEVERIEKARNFANRRAGKTESKSLESAIIDICLSNLNKEPKEIATMILEHFKNVQGINLENVQHTLQELSKRYEHTVTKLGDISLELSQLIAQ